MEESSMLEVHVVDSSLVEQKQAVTAWSQNITYSLAAHFKSGETKLEKNQKEVGLVHYQNTLY